MPRSSKAPDQVLNKSDKKNKPSSKKEEDVFFGFLFASPIYVENFNRVDKELVGFPQINWKEELRHIKREAKSTQLAVKIEAQVATSQSLINMLQKNLRVLHVSCHGVYDAENSILMTGPGRRPRQMGLNQHDPELERSYLLFETKTGEGEFISAVQI